MVDFSTEFLKSFKKNIQDIAEVDEGAEPPRWWISTGNVVLNKIISGSFFKGYPQGRLTSLSGPSGTGKSFLVCNAMREFQTMGGDIVLALDSENALDDEFVTNVGVNTKSGYMHIPVDTVSQTQNVVSKFIKGYKDEYGSDMINAPKVLIAIDSLDMLQTETEAENFEKGVFKGDQGQKNKQLKAMLRQFVQAIKHTNITMVVTNQVYKNQDILNGEGTWIVADAVKYSLSQIILLTKLKLRGATADDVLGIRMKCEGYKTRFTRPFQTVTIEVPYETGMDPNSGLVPVLVKLGILEKAGARYRISGTDTTFYEKDVATYAEDLVVKAEALMNVHLEVTEDDVEEDMDTETTTETKARRQAKSSSKKK